MSAARDLGNLANTAALKVTATDVGIQTATPSSDLDVGGNILMDGQQFGNFRKYMTKRFVDDMILNQNISHGLKEVITGALEVDNPLAVRMGGTLNLITSKTLREILLQ